MSNYFSQHINYTKPAKEAVDSALHIIEEKNSAEVLPRSVIEEMCQGDHDAFSKIYLHSYDKLKEFLNILLHNQEDAEEVVQDIFLYILENRDKINPQSNFKGYLYTIARTKAFDMMARRKLDEKYNNYHTHFKSDIEFAPDELVMTDELAVMVSIYIDNMPPQRRRVYEMSRLEGKSIKEIAETMNLSQQTVKNYLQTATNGLRKLLALFVVLFISR